MHYLLITPWGIILFSTQVYQEMVTFFNFPRELAFSANILTSDLGVISCILAMKEKKKQKKLFGVVIKVLPLYKELLH